jgi:Domain of unknown function (DUF4912)
MTIYLRRGLVLLSHSIHRVEIEAREAQPPRRLLRCVLLRSRVSGLTVVAEMASLMPGPGRRQASNPARSGRIYAAVVVGATRDGRASQRPGRVEIGCAFQYGPWILTAVDQRAWTSKLTELPRIGAAAFFMSVDDTPLPLGYGRDRLVLMVRDPASAHAYWDLSSDRVVGAVGPHFGGRAFLRLIGVPSGYLLAEHAVPIARGSQDVALPDADSGYMVELAVMRDYQWVVLARSNVIHAPPRTPRVMSRAQEPRGLAEGRDREFDSGRGPVVGAPTERAPHVGPAGRVGGSVQVGSEARLVGVDSEFGLASELRSAQGGSEARLVRREPAHMPFVIAGRAGLPEPVAVALGALAAAVWFGRDPVDVLGAGSALVGALAEAGVSAGPAIAILDPPGPGVAAPEPAGVDASLPGSEAYTVSENVDGSVTVIDRDGNSITYNPFQSAGVDRPRARSVAAIVGVRHAV